MNKQFILVFAFALSIAGVGLENTLGLGVTTILVFVGGLLYIGYFVWRGISFGNPRFMRARRWLLLSLYDMTLGVVIVSVGAAVSQFLNSRDGLVFEEIGVTAFPPGHRGDDRLCSSKSPRKPRPQ